MQREIEEQSNRITLKVLDRSSWDEWLSAMNVHFANVLEFENSDSLVKNEDAFESLQRTLREGNLLAFIAPRGIGLTDWRHGFSDSQTIAKKEIQIRRRYMQVGQTLDGMRVWDIQRAIHAINEIDGLESATLTIEAKDEMAVNVLYASIFEPNIDQLDLTSMPTSHRNGPDYLNVLRTLDIPAAVALAAENTKIRLLQANQEKWVFPITVSKNLSWEEDHISMGGAAR